MIEFSQQLNSFGYCHKKNRIGDVMRTPSMNDLSAHVLCNLPASA